MSYYASNYNQSSANLFGGPAKTTPFPGWGILPRAAGPARIAIGSPDGIGAISMTLGKRALTPTAIKSLTASSATTTPPGGGGEAGGGGGAEIIPTTEEGWPWWIWLAAPLAIGGIGLFAYDYFTGKPNTP